MRWAAVALVALPMPARNATADVAADDAIQVRVTGSNIPAIARESALPVQVITREEIEQANLQTAAQIVATISATMSFSGRHDAQGVGGVAQSGFAGGALRGLGYQFTLVLVNGRRVANYPLVARGTDLNAIPTAAIDRVEVLKDGASAIYGSDAIGGVINFILRRDFRGVEGYAQYAVPEASGGRGAQVTAAAGWGELATQRFNANLLVDYQDLAGIEARERPFAARAYVPEAGLDRTSVNAYPANVLVPLRGLRNPGGDAAAGYADPPCEPPSSIVTGSSRYACRWAGDGSTTIVPPSERLAAVGAFTWQVDRDHQVFVDANYSRNTFDFVYGPTEVSRLTSLNRNAFLLPATSPHYPSAFARHFGIDGQPLDVYWTAADLGSRAIATTSELWNAVGGVRGGLGGWAYEAALTYSRSSARNEASAGHVRESLLFPVVNTGLVNPFAPNAPAAVDLLRTARFEGTLREGKTSTFAFDITASRTVFDLAAGPVSVATGASLRRDTDDQVSDRALEVGDVMGLPSVPTWSASRTGWAVFAEASAPLTRTFDVDVAVRYDHYDDLGGTTNPKVAMRWQPLSTVLVRASAGTGFLAPGLPGRYEPEASGFTPPGLSDPVRCPVTGAAQDCNRAFPNVRGGNPDLKPVTSRQWGVGAVWAPMRTLSIGVDYVAILLDDRINFFSAQDILAQCPEGANGPSCYLIRRGNPDVGLPALPGPIVEIDQRRTNLGKARASAIDVSIQYATRPGTQSRFAANFTGTYNIANEQEQLDGSYVDQVNRYSAAGGNPGVSPHWRHFLLLTWSGGPWSVSLSDNYQSGTLDQAPSPGSGDAQRRIDDYDVWDLAVFYRGFPGWTLSAGVDNLFDRDPPFSVQTQNVQVGYDPSYADPRGRTFWAGVRYGFR